MPPSDSTFIPYSRQSIDDDDVRAVLDVLHQSFLTTGPAVDAFEQAVAKEVAVRHAVAVSNGTAGLHLALLSLGIGPGDEVIVPALTFAATASTVLMCNAVPVVVDVMPDTGLIDTEKVRQAITTRTRAMVAVDYTGAPCDYAALHEIVNGQDIALVSDACHSLGATYRGRPIGHEARATVVSFHPVKSITTGEGGMVLTDDAETAARARRLRNHGIDRDHRDRKAEQTWSYDVVELGYNYRLTDLQCALGLSQIKKLDRFIERRRAIATRYDAFFAGIEGASPLTANPFGTSAHHLYVIRVDAAIRDHLFRHLFAEGIGANVHYRPVHRLSGFRDRIRVGEGGCPAADDLFGRILSLPIYPAMTAADQDRVEAVIRTYFSGRIARTR